MLHCKYHVKPHSSSWFSAVFAAPIVHRNHFFRLYQQKKSSESKVTFRHASNCWAIPYQIIKFLQNLTPLPLKISAPNSQWFLSGFFNNFWSKGPIKLKFGTGQCLAREVQKSHQEYTKTNQCSVLSHFKFLLCLTESGTRKVCGTTVIQKIFFSSETKDINLTFCQNRGWVLFQIFQNKGTLRHFLGPLNKSFLELVAD